MCISMLTSKPANLVNLCLKSITKQLIIIVVVIREVSGAASATIQNTAL